MDGCGAVFVWVKSLGDLCMGKCPRKPGHPQNKVTTLGVNLWPPVIVRSGCGIRARVS